ncbi:MAG: phytanoyl-CoA dioxygenase family protein [Pirellulales bacterium]
MSFQHLKAPFDRDGFVIVRQLLPAADFAELNRQLDRYIREVVPGLPDTDAFYDADRSRPETLRQLHRIDQDPFFASYRNNPIWRSLAEALVGEEVTALSPEWFNKPPLCAAGTPPHQDNYYFCLDPCNVLTIWMALDAVDDENACMRYVVGSHREGVRPHARSNVLGFSQGITDYGPLDASREVAIHLKPGDVSVHHGNLIHLAGANRSATRHRRAFAIVFQGASCRRDADAFARYQASVKAQQDALAPRAAAGKESTQDA